MDIMRNDSFNLLNMAATKAADLEKKLCLLFG